MAAEAFGIRFGDLHGLLGAIGPIPFDGVPSRIKYLQRRGFPAGANPGLGGKMRYDLTQVLKMVLAFQLFGRGMSPGEAAAEIESIWTDARTALVENWWCREVEGSWADRPLLVLAGQDRDRSAAARPLVRASRHIEDVTAGRNAPAATMLDPLPIVRAIAQALPLATGLTLEEITTAFADLPT